MPEYLSPGVYVEEVSFRSKSIEGVPTSTTGFAGLTRTGPVQYGTPDIRPSTTEPRLVTSFTEFERVYGGLESLELDHGNNERLPYLAHAARAFFLNGGQRLYVSRVFAPTGPQNAPDWGVATRTIAVGGGTATWTARWPGAFGNVFVQTLIVRTKNIAFVDPANTGWGPQAKGAKQGAVVEVISPPPADPSTLPKLNEVPTPGNLWIVEVLPNGQQQFRQGGGLAGTLPAGAVIQLIQLQVQVTVDNERLDVYTELATSPDQKRYIGKILQKNHPEDEDAVVWLDCDTVAATPTGPIDLVVALRNDTNGRLTNGNDGTMPAASDLEGEPADLDHAEIKATGLEALQEIDDIAIIALPDGSTYDDNVDECFAAMDALRSMADRQGSYRIAVLDGPQNSSMTDIRNFRGQFDSTYAALYHPWVEIFDPLERPAQGAATQAAPAAAVGIRHRASTRARDIDRGVCKAPANEIVTGLTKFETNINKGRQDVLNPEGINALRFFEGRGNRVWGARTMSSDPEWKYVNVRRLFIFLEHSIDKSTQWAVFEPNNERLWANIRQHGRGLPPRPVARRRADGHEARGGVLRPLRPHDHDPERPRQRAADLPDRRRARRSRRSS